MVKFLIIRFSSIGDIVLTTPVIRCLKEQVDESEIHFLTKKQFSSVLENNPNIDHLWLYDNNLNQIINDLIDVQFDYVIDLHHNLRTFYVKNRLRLLSFSFDKLNLKKWLLVNFKINLLPEIHIVDRYMATTKLFGINNDGKGLDYFLSDNDKEFPAEIRSNIPEKFIALSIGANHKTKKVPPSKLAEICDKLELPVVILGGKTDVAEASEIKKLCSKNHILDLTDKLSLNRSASIILLSELVITHDTGLMHIAAAFKKKIISIWGNTIPEFGMYPYLPGERSEIFEVKGLRCRPCSKIGFNKCPKGHFNCMMQQDTEKIASLANTLCKEYIN